MQEAPKVWWKSKTLWFNVVLLIVAFVPHINTLIPLPSEFLELVALIGNIVLRLQTSASITLK